MPGTIFSVLAPPHHADQFTARGDSRPAIDPIPSRPVPSPVFEQPRRSADDIVGEALVRRLADLPADNPDRPRIRTRTIEHYLPYAARLARKYGDRGETVADLLQVAAVGLINAVDRYDPTYGVPFTHFAGPTIVGEIKRHFRDRVPTLRVPRSIQDNRLTVRDATATLSQRLGRRPTVAELATHLGISESDVTAALLAAGAFRPLSLSIPVGDPDFGMELGDLLGDVHDALAAIDDRETLRPLLAQLPHREQRILAMRYFANMSQTEIATALGLSQMHISRLLARSLTQLRTAAATTDRPAPALTDPVPQPHSTSRRETRDLLVRM